MFYWLESPAIDPEAKKARLMELRENELTERSANRK